MAGQCQPLRRQLPRAVEHRGRIIHIVLQHAGIGRAKDCQRHLVGDGKERILEQLEFDGVAEHRGVLRRIGGFVPRRREKPSRATP